MGGKTMSQRASAQHQKRQIGYVVVCTAAPLLTTLLVAVATRDTDPPQRERVFAPPRPGELAAIEREARSQAAGEVGGGRSAPNDSSHATPDWSEMRRRLDLLEQLHKDIASFVARAQQDRSLITHFSLEVSERALQANSDSPVLRLNHGPLRDALRDAAVDVPGAWWRFVNGDDYEEWQLRAGTSLTIARDLLDAASSENSQ